MAASDFMIDIRSVTKRFGDFTAVNDVSLQVRAGEFITLLGPSGCGKTTSLRMMAGLETPSSGQILIGGEEVTHLHPKDRNIAMVFQDYALYPHMNLADNIAYPLKVRGEAVDKRHARAKDVADVLNKMSEQLTTLDLTRMIGQVDLERQLPADVAKEYLTQAGLIDG